MAVKINAGLEGRVSYLARQMTQDFSLPPIVFFDTGAIIDIEREVREEKLRDKSANISAVFNGLGATGSTFYIPRAIFEEIEKHHLAHLINGRPEVTLETMEVVSEMHVEYMKFAQSVGDIENDEVKYHTYWASKLAFGSGHKKSYKESISDPDKELINTGLTIGKHLASQNGSRANGGIVIMSPDSHIRDTVKVLTDTHPQVEDNYPDVRWRFGYNGIKVVTTRQYK